jgi:carboxyl-terminal processing protease
MGMRAATLSSQACGRAEAAAVGAVAGPIGPSDGVTPPPSGGGIVARPASAPRRAAASTRHRRWPTPIARAPSTDEKNWVRSWIDETYLWYDEVPTTLRPPTTRRRSPTSTCSRRRCTTASGRAKDRFHFTYDTEPPTAAVQQGVSGRLRRRVRFRARTRRAHPRGLWSSPDSPAAGRHRARLQDAGHRRRRRHQRPAGRCGPPSTARWRRHQRRIARLQAARTTAGAHRHAGPPVIERSPVQNVAPSTRPAAVGYLQFNDHVAKSEAQLVAAINN